MRMKDRCTETAKRQGRLTKMLIVLALAASAQAVPATVVRAQEQQQDAPPTIRDEPGKAESKIPDIDNGNKLARTLCTACHLIGEPSNAAAVPADVPSFASIANRPNQSREHLLTWLTAPHPPMPNINLTRIEMRDLAGYILSLRLEK
jgi:mono/diheme cytochrome c family protein